ncbi:MAG: hypothetical protein WA058_03480 [Minisyncoccia bacterium]
MTIAEARGKCKSFLARVPRDVLILGVLLLSSGLSFALGYLAGLDAEPAGAVTAGISSPENLEQAGQIVASKSGTKYYLSSCAGADRISEINKVWFSSVAAAGAAGYAPAANCKGL